MICVCPLVCLCFRLLSIYCSVGFIVEDVNKYVGRPVDGCSYASSCETRARVEACCLLCVAAITCVVRRV